MASKLFENLTLLDEATADVTFNFKNGDNVKAHRLILATKNRAFLAMLLNDTTERQTGIINIENCDAEAFKVFLKYLYTGDVKKEDISIDLLQISDRYLDDSLKKKCEEELGQDINDDNVLEKFVAAIAYHCDNLKASTYSFIRRNLNELIKKPEFDELCKHKEAVKTLLLGSSIFANGKSYFQPLNDVSSFLTSFEKKSPLSGTYFTKTIPYVFNTCIGDLVWQIDLTKEKNTAGYEEICLSMMCRSSYFECCTADIAIILEKCNKTLGKVKQNIQINDRRSTKIHVIRDDDFIMIQDITKQRQQLLKKVYDPRHKKIVWEEHKTDPNSEPFTMKISFALYDVVRSRTNN